MLKEGIPRHSQISQWLRTSIEEGRFSPEEKLPSENELAKKFDVSRVTIRRALQSLESEKIIYRCQGLGSFVSDKRAPHNLVRLTDFNEDMARAGLNATSHVEELQVTDAEEWLLEPLQLEKDSRVVVVDRLRMGDGEPIAFDRTWLPLFYGQLLKQNELADKTIYRILEEEYDIRIMRGSYRISATVSDSELAERLHVECGFPLLRIDRTTFSVGDRPVYYQTRYYRSDRVIYEMRLERDPGSENSSSEMPLKEFLPVFRSE